MKIRPATGTGLWPQFWMLGDDVKTVGWPLCGEIDTMETIDQDLFTVNGTLHGPSLGAPFNYAWPRHGPPNVAGIGLSRVRRELEPDGDQMAARRRRLRHVNASRPPTRAYNKPFHILLNLSVGGSWPGPPNASTAFPATLAVDWVRVYQ